MSVYYGGREFSTFPQRLSLVPILLQLNRYTSCSYFICYINIIHPFNVHWSVHRKNILIYVQQDAKLHSLFYLETALHVSDGTTTHHQERRQLYLQHLVFVTPLLLPAAIQVAVMVLQIPDAVDTVVCAPDGGWWYHPKHVE